MSKQPKQSRQKFFGARFTAIISISLVLFVLGIISFLGIFANQLSTFVKENIGFTVILDDDIKESDLKKINTFLDKSAFAREVNYISKEAAIKELTDDLGENPEDFLGFNPLQASFEVKLNADYAHPDSIVYIERAVRSQSKHIFSFDYRKDIVSLVNENIQKATWLLLGLAAMLLIISFTLISNTVRLNIYSKRFLIHTMRLVGATPGFIRRPFIWTNIINGIIASCMAMAMVLGLLYGVTQEYIGFRNLINMEQIGLVFTIILALSILITTLASFFATNRYIRMRSDDMYLV